MPQAQKQQPSEIDRLLVDYSSRRLDEEADRQGVPRDFARRILGAESGGQADVISGRRRSRAGAIGPMQLMPGTAADLDVDPYNIDENIEGGVRYLKRQFDSFGGDQTKAAAAYNAGPRNVRKYRGVPPFKETQEYVRKTAGQGQGGSEIDRLYDQFAGQQRSAPAEPKPAPLSTARRLGFKPVEWPEGKALNLSTGEFIDESQQSKYNPPTRPLQPGEQTRRAIAAKAKPPTRDQRIADIANQMRQREMKESAIAETQTRLDKLSDAELSKEHTRLTKIFATVPETLEARAEEERRRAEYYAKPLPEQIGREILGGMAEAGAGISRAVHRLTDPIGRALGYGEEIDRERAREEESERQLAEETALANRLRSKVVRGVSAGAGQAATLVPVAAATGPVGVTALTALQSDVERDPGGALASTIAAPVSIAAGRFVSPRAARVASGFASKPAQKTVQVGVEGLAGAGANVGQYAATSAALGRPITAEDLTEQAVTGAALSAPGALAAARRTSTPGRIPEPKVSTAPPVKIRATGLAVEEAAIRARLGLTDGAEASTAKSSTRSPAAAASQIDQLYDQFTGGQGKAPRPRPPAVRVEQASTEQPAVSVRPDVEEMTPQFRDEARRRTLTMLGVSPEMINAEMARLKQQDVQSVPSTEQTSALKAPAEEMLAETAPEKTRSQRTVLGSGLGPLQPMLENVKLPSRAEVSETAGGLQTAAQLGNPRFVIRNVLQHVVYGKQERAATRLAAALDWAYSAATGKPRQIAAPHGSDLASYARNWSKAIEAYKAGQPLPGKPNADYMVADGNAINRGVGKLMTWINEIPDAANWQTRFEQSLQSIVEGAKKSKATLDTDAAIDQAWMEANRAALRDPNFASTAMLKIKQGLNSLSKPIFGTDKFGVGDFVNKYAQTPGALLKRGLERSPLGLFQVAKEAATPGPFRRRNTLLALSRVAEGAATGMGLGAALAAGGILVGPEGEGRTGQAMEREEGVRGYSLNASALRRFLTGESTEMREGDQLYSIDWIQPWALNLSVGAALMNLHKDGKLGAMSGAEATGEAIYRSLSKTLDVMGDQSVLKNLGRYWDRAPGETFGAKFLNVLKNIGLDAPSSFAPSLARQTRQVMDPYERDTRAEERGGLRGFISEATNRVLAQLPGASETLPTRPSLLTGKDKKTAIGQMSLAARIAAQVSPANISTYAPQPVAREISRLSHAGEKVSVTFPRAIVDKETGKRESTAVLRERERRFAEAFALESQELIDSPGYTLAEDDAKAKLFKKLVERLRKETRE